MASIWLPGVATNITPLFTIGGAWWPSTWPVAMLQTGCSRATLSGIDITAIAAATPAFPDLAHLSRTGASNGLNSSYYSKSLGEIHAAGPEHVWCGGVEEPDHRQHPLLRARRNRPRSRCAAEQRDEVASSHVPLAAHFHCFTEPVGHGGLRCSANPPYRAAPHAYYFT